MEITATSPRRNTTLAFAAGIAAAVVATAGMLALSVALDRPSIAELVAEAIANVTPLEVIERMISAFGSSAKRLLFVSVLLGQVAVGGGLAAFSVRRGWTFPQGAAGLGIVVATTGLVVLPLLGAGILGSNTRAGVGATLLGLLVIGAIYLVAFAAVWRYLHPGGFLGAEVAASRRRMLKNGAVLVGSLAVGIGSFRWLAARLAPPELAPVASSEASLTTVAVASADNLLAALETGVPGLPPEITSNDKFYVVSKNLFRDPEVDQASWRLEVAGLVDRPRVLTYEEMRALPADTQYFTLQCISNEVGGELISNALWRGTSLGNLLRQAGVQPGAVDVVFHAADGYTDSIPIEKAMQPDTMLAYEMNGQVLPKEHGFPVRMLIPDIYGMKNAKWVTKIEVVEYDFQGYWMLRGWGDTAIMNTTSRIDVPRNGSFLRPGTNYVGGVAVAGQRGIQKVEVSTDAGRTWEPAVVKPALGPNTWSLWLYAWDLPAGEATPQKILVRATDGTGAVQTSMVRETIPDGATGYHAIIVKPATQS